MTSVMLDCMECQKVCKESFPTEESFINHEKLLWKLVGSGSLVAEEPTKALNKCFTEKHFRCTKCRKIWVCSFPDQAYRGFCLPFEKAHQE